MKVNGVDVRSTADVSNALIDATRQGYSSCALLFAQPEIQHGLTNEGIPQVNIDQLNPWLSFSDIPLPSVPDKMSTTVKTLWDNSGDVWEWHNASVYKLTRGALFKSDDWDEW